MLCTLLLRFILLTKQQQETNMHSLLHHKLFTMRQDWIINVTFTLLKLAKMFAVNELQHRLLSLVSECIIGLHAQNIMYQAILILHVLLFLISGQYWKKKFYTPPFSRHLNRSYYYHLILLHYFIIILVFYHYIIDIYHFHTTSCLTELLVFR